MPKFPRVTAQAVIAFLLVLGGQTLVVLLFFVTPPAANERLVDLGLGTFFGAFTTAVAYYLGSSRGSAAKDATIAASSNALAAQATPDPAPKA